MSMNAYMTSEQLVEDVLEAYRPALMPGGVEALLDRYRKGDGARSPGAAAAVSRLVEFLESDEATPYFDPEADRPRGRSAVRDILSKFPIKRSSIDVLTKAWGLKLQQVGDAGRIAGEIARLLGKDENHHHLRADRRPGPTREARKVRDALEHFRGHLDPAAALDDVARRWAREIGGYPPAEVAKRVADRLQMDWHAEGLTRSGRPLEDRDIDRSDPVFHNQGGAVIDRARTVPEGKLTPEERAVRQLLESREYQAF
jgi:hypothetical protein